jgi:hypothetical protein
VSGLAAVAGKLILLVMMALLLALHRPVIALLYLLAEVKIQAIAPLAAIPHSLTA